MKKTKKSKGKILPKEEVLAREHNSGDELISDVTSLSLRKSFSFQLIDEEAVFPLMMLFFRKTFKTQ